MLVLLYNINLMTFSPEKPTFAILRNDQTNPFEAQTEKGFMYKVISPARARIIAGLLMIATPSVEGCGASISRGENALAAIGLEKSKTNEPINPSKRGMDALGSINRLEKPEIPDLPNYQVMIDRLRDGIGGNLLESAIGMHEAYEYRTWDHENKPQLRNFENLELDNNEMAKYLSLYPKSWLTEISSISISTHYVPMIYPGAEAWAEMGRASRSFEGNPIRITLNGKHFGSKEASDRSIMAMLDTITHELAHASDPLSNAKLSTEQALSIMYMAFTASTDPGRPKFHCEMIKVKPRQTVAANPTQEKAEGDAAFAKMEEYFAELIGSAFKVGDGNSWKTWKPHFAKMLNSLSSTPEAAEWNYKMVRYYFAWAEPDYKIWEASRNIELEKEELVNKRLKRRTQQF